MAFGQVANTSASALLPMTQLHTPARQTHILPALSFNLLLSVRTFADNGCVTIFHEGNRGAMSISTMTSQSPAQSLPFSKGAETKTDSGEYPLQNLPAYYTILLGIASTTSTTSHQPHIQFDTSMLHSVFPPKTPCLQQFEAAISPCFLDSLQPTSQIIFPNLTRCRKGT